MSKIPQIDSFQRAWLRKQAHHLSPVVNVGVAGMSDAVEKAIDDALTHHELIKVKFYELKDERRDACEHAAQTLNAVVVSIIGNVGILYRPAPESGKQTIHLPKRSSKDSATEA